MRKTIYFVTGNKNKLKEARQILTGFRIRNIKIDLPELQGKPREIAKEKAKLAADKTGKTVFVEDTCLCFNALKGLPGPYIKDFLELLGNEGLVKLLADFKDKRAKAITTIGYCQPGKQPRVFAGVVNGKIVKPCGKKRFGWDPIFQPKGYSKTFAQITKTEKNKISHRKKAFEAFRKYLEKR